MIERKSINGRDVWLKVDPYRVQRDNPNTIPTEYFMSSYFWQEPTTAALGEIISDDDGGPKLFESPVAALSYTRKKLEATI